MNLLRCPSCDTVSAVETFTLEPGGGWVYRFTICCPKACQGTLGLEMKRDNDAINHDEVESERDDLVMKWNQRQAHAARFDPIKALHAIAAMLSTDDIDAAKRIARAAIAKAKETP